MADRSYKEREFMEIAIEEARKSKSGKYDPMVGAVIARGDQLIEKAFRGEGGDGVHAEASALKKIDAKRRNDAAIGSTVYTTLEPCTTRKKDRWPCANLLISRQVSRVVIGMLDPNKDIRGQGEWQLEDTRIKIGKFEPDLVQVIRDLNRDFIDYETGLGIHISTPKEKGEVTRGPVELAGTFRMHPRAGDAVAALVRYKTSYAPQQRISFNRDLGTWSCNVWCNAEEDDVNEYELIVARINDDIQVLQAYYSQVHTITGKWIAFEMSTVPSGLEILDSVIVKRVK